jgi:para-aminobenzoate synthetase/4-amino-4-deoxychorismate lyase
MWQQAQQALQLGQYVVAVLSYETGAQLQQIEARSTPAKLDQISQLLVFRKCQHWNRQQVAEWLEQQCVDQYAGIRDIRANVDARSFREAIEKIRDYIAAGDTYQVNYTYRLHFKSYGSALALYRALRHRQPVPFAALIALPDGRAILSLSPELFIRHQNGHLIAKPMKGTAAASGEDKRNLQIAEELRQDPKNRAENLMIVDLLRNDLGRIAQIGSVKVPALFEVQRFSSVLQMTSTITARLRPELELEQIMSALFPCGSITGAPKRRTMEVIRELETEDRGVYTGAIGWFDPAIPSQTIGNFCLSVPIRTLVLQAEDAQGCRQGVMGVGAGIVYDSVAQEEFAECALKAKFLTGLTPDFELFETMYATRELGCRHLNRHLNRLQTSASYFEFSFDREDAVHQLQAYCDQFTAQTAYRVRLSITYRGHIQIQHAVLNPITEPVRILISPQVCETSAIFLAHKSSHRLIYDQAWQAAEKLGGFDSLFINQNGFITEGGRCNVFVKIENQWFTPPLSDGVLPGIMRGVLLEDKEMQARERSLTLADLRQADEIMVCNALRGALVAHLQRS